MSNGGLISGAFAEQSAHTGGIDLTQKGDLHGYSDDDARIPISTNNFSLLCDSNQSLGLKWAASPTSIMTAAMDILYSSSANTLARLAAGSDGYVLATHGTGSIPTWAASPTSIMTAAMDILYSSSANTLARLAAGSDGKVLTTHSTGSAPTWETPSGVTVESDHEVITSGSTTTSTSMTGSSLNITIGNISNGQTLITATLVASRSTAGGTEFSLADDGTVIDATWVAFDQTASDSKVVIPLNSVMSADASEIVVYFMTGGGTVQIHGSSSEFTSQLMALNVG